MRLVRCNLEEHGSAILRILNDAILTSTALYDYAPRPLSSMTSWFEEKRAGAFPVWGALGDDDALLGFASYGVFRVRPAYKYTVEHSVYVDAAARGRGVGTRLMERLIQSAIEQEKHVLVGGVDAGNVASVKLHEALGFEAAGIIKQAGFKFGRWLDLAFYQLILPTPHAPADG
ncbi:MAG: N-acetyltransferase family protein [Myxococcales bacterium]|nr:MAG: N-acetyltransferase family protein [Myxococcales bacterium]